MKLIKLLLKILSIILGTVAVIAIIALVFFTANEYRPDSVEQLDITGSGETLSVGDTITVMTYNVGYGSMGKDTYILSNKDINFGNQATVESNLEGMAQEMLINTADIYLLQEVDTDSKRSLNIDQFTYFENKLNISSSFAYDFNCILVPYPISFSGKVESGISIFTQLNVSEAYRLSLSSDFSWPRSTFSPKRCLLVNRIPIDESDKELVVINLHLDVDDSGYLNYEQFNQLKEVISQEYLKGNYVIAGGTFNYLFPDTEQFAAQGNDYWNPIDLTEENIPADFQYVTDTSVPSCRLLNQPYSSDLKNAQYYILDGFIVSCNLLVESVKTLATDFEYSDHQPVIMSVTLK